MSSPEGASQSLRRRAEACGSHILKGRFSCLCAAVILFLACSPFLLGQQSNAPSQTPAGSGGVLRASTSQQPYIPQLQQRNPRYRIQNGDTISLTFPFTPQFNNTVIVEPDGYISLREVGDLKAEGLTLPELNEALQTAYSKILNDPVITATLSDFVKPYFTVTGEVNKPSKYELHGDTTVAESIAIAGGFTAAAKHSQVLVFRRKNADWVEVHKLNVKRMLNSRDLSEDMHLQPGDLVFVPKSMIAKIGPMIPYNLFRLTFSNP